MGNRTIKESLKKLAKYPKSDIIEALGQQYQSEYIIKNLLIKLEDREQKKVLNEHKKALDAEIEIRKEYLNWINEMCVKYGDGKAVKMGALPQSEISKGAEIETALNEAIKTKSRLDAKVNKLLKFEE